MRLTGVLGATGAKKAATTGCKMVFRTNDYHEWTAGTGGGTGCAKRKRVCSGNVQTSNAQVIVIFTQ